MKRTNTSKIVIMLMLLTALILSCLPIQALTTTTYYEDFNSITPESVPVAGTGATALKYTFSTVGFTYAKVSTVDASIPFYMNDSATQAYANFTFNETYDADSFSFYYLTYNDQAKARNHSGASMLILGQDTLLTINVYGWNQTTYTNNRTVITDHAGAEIINVTSATDNWYKVTLTFDWLLHKDIKVVLYDATGATTLATAYADIPATDTYFGEFQIQNKPATDKAVMIVDNFVLAHTVYTQVDVTTNTLLLTVLPIILAALIITVIFGLALSGNLMSKEGLITIMIISIIGVIIIQIITSL